jgi:hypothetical protein
MSAADPRLALVRPVVPHTDRGCGDCLRTGSAWVHLKLYLTCGHVGGCDSSPMRHAVAHVCTVGHPIVQSLEPGEGWHSCYGDQAYV